MHQQPIFHHLITAIELRDRLHDESLRLLDCRFSLLDKDAGYASYLRKHIPGASYVHLENDLSGTISHLTGRHPLPNPDLFAKRIGELGVDESSYVVAYDTGSGAQAARLWWLLRWIGYPFVSVLDGGFNAWQRCFEDSSNGVENYQRSSFVRSEGLVQWVGTDDVSLCIKDANSLLIDAREFNRFVGKEEPLDPIAGHIPGSKNRPFHDNLDSTGKYKPRDKLYAEFMRLLRGKDPSNVIHSCGSGVTACQNLLAMEVSGMSGSRLYPGSWSEWITDSRRPIVQNERIVE